MRIGERVATSCGALLPQIQGQNFSPQEMLDFLGFWSSNPEKIEKL
jgi:hypothetical protein